MEEKKPRYGLYINDEYYGVLDPRRVVEELESQITEQLIDNDDYCEIRIKRIDMTDAEFDAMPEE